ncbi:MULTISPECIES: N-acetylglucosamine/diacetylchitobiose ABC transporter substrate-binding protein [unclassified Microbacterium]|uniref:N-acetylglucosamine/diacetylchitobiose ABC transporter substrate-binding protein n=1 Tax=unclassified Microbacterium TaxID=2609290 RepID=UPI001ACFEA2B|nr:MULTISPECIES: N-acetylglucosamine/diacetylchitobiose ABC transporter substrate-binding protein [unclassified Microbacterium]MBN9156210.1 N-acetylglucosamine/diacetylchitobiose ABC transporter substrate-binding protein [Microbacterium sp.]MBS1896703.1 N-acetylglucosamine/diacetylchitobiose ABC transporter substrate-binding protein [Actinomycetota bacterium]MBS1899269.1 N-acetylglucosamine/diacetylchitobiose ABC transporter substrate-binding protein [Actinomycetota bacterium]
METKDASIISRRSLLRGAALAAVMVPLGVSLASCAGPSGGSGSGSAGGTKSADNPFGVAANSKVDAVIFDGGYGVDYVENAAKIMGGNKKLDGATAKISPSTKIAQELQPRFVGGNPPDLIDNSGANSIGWNTILDQLEDLTDVLESNNLEGTKISDTLYGGVKDPGTFGGKFVAINYFMTVFGLWYSSSLFEKDGYKVPTSWQDLKDLGAAAKAKGKYLFVWGKEAATYYQTLVIDSAVIQSGDDVRLPLENLKENCWSHPTLQSILTILYDLIQAGYMKPGGSGTQFTQAQSQWSLDEAALLYPSGSWIENEMKKQTADGFKMMGIPELPLDDKQTTPKGTMRAEAGEPFVVPTKAKNAAGGKELLRTMLSKEAATWTAKSKFAPTIVKGTVPDDAFGSTALASQIKMLDAAGENVFTIKSTNLYGMNSDQLPIWNSFLDGKMTVAEITKALQDLVDKVRNDSSVTKIEIK